MHRKIDTDFKCKICIQIINIYIPQKKPYIVVRLGIAGGESKWVPQKEGMTYNPVRLKEIFKNSTDEQVQRYSYAEKKGMTRAEFFAFFYGTTYGKGKMLGNKSDEDGEFF